MEIASAHGTLLHADHLVMFVGRTAVAPAGPREFGHQPRTADRRWRQTQCGPLGFPLPRTAHLPARGAVGHPEAAGAVETISQYEGMAAHEATATIRLDAYRNGEA